MNTAYGTIFRTAADGKSLVKKLWRQNSNGSKPDHILFPDGRQLLRRMQRNVFAFAAAAVRDETLTSAVDKEHKDYCNLHFTYVEPSMHLMCLQYVNNKPTFENIPARKLVTSSTPKKLNRRASPFCIRDRTRWRP